MMDMNRFSNLSIRGKLLALVIGYTVLMAGVLGIEGYLLATYRIKGPAYERIMFDKQLLLETSPSSIYITEHYIILQELESAMDPVEVRDSIRQFKDLEKDYADTRQEYLDKLTIPELKKSLENAIHRPIVELFKIAEEEYLPKVGKGGPDAAIVSKILRDKIKPLFVEHRKAIQLFIDQLNALSQAYEQNAVEESTSWFRGMSIFSVIIVILIGYLGWWMINGITHSTTILIERVNEMASGASDLTARIKLDSNDELGQLAGGINKMIEKIQHVVARVRESSIRLLSVASQIAATARSQEGTVASLSSSTSEAAASVREISATSQDLSGTMSEVNDRSNQAAALAAGGRDSLTKMESEIQNLIDSTASVSAKLGMIREKADNINVVVTTITKVADQTNLLSINAAIEAEKAGEYGRGFLVVAREIRRLADQTAVATLEIENMVRLMQESVSAGVMQMDKFSDEVRGSARRVAEVNGTTTKILGEVQTLSSRFQLVNEGMRNQAIGAQQINDAMLSMSDGARQSSDSLKEFERATAHLRSSVEALNHEISEFKI
jgi:methyl-accepting chemotaxis protein WspA